MRSLFLILIVLFSGCSSIAQFGYEDYSKPNGLKIATKWGSAKDEAGERKPALLLAIENTNVYPVTFSFDINLYYEGILRETGRIEGQCIEGLKSMVGKLNGIYFIPEKFTQEQLKSSDFNFSIDAVDVTEVENCPDGE